MLSSEDGLTSARHLIHIWVFFYLQRGSSPNSLQDQELRRAEINCLAICSLVSYLHELCFLFPASLWVERCFCQQQHWGVPQRPAARRCAGAEDGSCVCAGGISGPGTSLLAGWTVHLHLPKAASVSTSCPDAGRGYSTLGELLWRKSASHKSCNRLCIFWSLSTGNVFAWTKLKVQEVAGFEVVTITSF